MSHSSDYSYHHVSFDIPVPVNYGGAIDVFHKIRMMSGLGDKIHLHCFQYGREEAPLLNTYCEQVEYYPRQGHPMKFLSPLPYIVRSRASDRLLENLCKDDHPILFEGLHSCHLLTHPRLQHRRKIVRTHNIEHEYYKSLAQVEKHPLRKLYFQLESRRLLTFESVLRQADGIAAISLNDSMHFRSKYPNVVKVSAFHPFCSLANMEGTGDYVLYHGSLEVGENNEAALFLVNQVFNTLRIPFIIAGNKPSAALRQAVSRFPHISLRTGLDTEAIYELVRNAHINILPTFQATGIKLKLLAALFTGRHCVVNYPMVKDTGLEDLCILANTPEEIRDAVQKLIAIPFTGQDIRNREAILLNNGFSNDYNARILHGMLFD